ncbi:acylphosphatase [Pseudoxanthomonas winnipegensis]|uniref:Acylphosphatase n=1 Tax=Pseudoxanthomonas winnipegensis TaxID=2480810 RepID=A0A4Q8LHV6_9GAMM|nr:acylphosphatase [Pseudoxanthomonas winnipegensis]TAA28864.1 acylphosphatase [Pseudoxanthomonas winnipegensis]
MSVIAARFLVGGRVQGVGFRASTRERARALGLDGYARNLADGRVEVVARGEPAAVEALAAWLTRGPAPAQVDALERADWQGTVAPGFAIG